MIGGNFMMISRSSRCGKKITAGIFLFILTACVTINIYFPAAKVRKAAEDIVRDVRGKDASDQWKAPDVTHDSAPRSRLRFISQAWAHGQELNVSNATIRTLKSRIKGNYPLLRQWLMAGVLGENYEGYLTLKNENNLNLRDKVNVKRLMNQENSNRQALYKAVAGALNVPASEIGRVGRIFAQQWQATVPPGTWIEKEPGKWIRH